MTTFHIITEADARRLDTGSTVVLAKGGHITPLASDTLRERRVTVQYEGTDPDAGGLAPPAEIRTLVLGSDHTGIALRSMLRTRLRAEGRRVIDVGADSRDPVDYPDIAAAVARSVARGEADAGVVIDGSGLGSAIAANKIHGVRAAACGTTQLARYARQHNGANVLALGSTLTSEGDAWDILKTFVDTPMREPRYIRRLAKIRDLELAQ